MHSKMMGTGDQACLPPFLYSFPKWRPTGGRKQCSCCKEHYNRHWQLEIRKKWQH
jgi:hypothetical protein